LTYIAQSPDHFPSVHHTAEFRHEPTPSVWRQGRGALPSKGETLSFHKTDKKFARVTVCPMTRRRLGRLVVPVAIKYSLRHTLQEIGPDLISRVDPDPFNQELESPVLGAVHDVMENGNHSGS
jgi:hypothetical protein